MRKSNPNYLRKQFRQELDDLIDYFDRLIKAIRLSKHEKADASRLAESVFVSAYVGFEGFVSNLFVAYLNLDPRVFQRFYDNKIRQSAEKFGVWHIGRLSFSTIRHVNVDSLRGILDPDQRNITFGSATKMKERAKEVLAATYRARIQALTDDDARVLDTAKAIRNYIAHRSASAYKEMNEHLDAVDRGTPNTDLGRGVNLIQAVGSFLKSETQTKRRVILYIRRLQAISATL